MNVSLMATVRGIEQGAGDSVIVSLRFGRPAQSGSYDTIKVIISPGVPVPRLGEQLHVDIYAERTDLDAPDLAAERAASPGDVWVHHEKE